MATVEVLLLKFVRTLGAEGDRVRVKSGYARNFLFPNGIALPLTCANRKQIEALQRAKAMREAHDLEEARDLEKQLSCLSLAIAVKTGDSGKMFGSVTAKEICDHLASSGIVIDRKKIHLNAPIREIGRHKISIKLHQTISMDLPLEIVSENPIA
ncbi:MAG: 50S ribosomal protein L9 [Puniceicoccales bacterium]|jgi:large subunit ribosomal protein L9|nr:50S ribosomal protein L9 [Puniceicoccales bacterium]